MRGFVTVGDITVRCDRDHTEAGSAWKAYFLRGRGSSKSGTVQTMKQTLGTDYWWWNSADCYQRRPPKYEQA